MARPYNPANGGQNPDNFAPGGYYNPDGAYGMPGGGNLGVGGGLPQPITPPASVGGGLPAPGLLPPPASIGGGLPQPRPINPGQAPWMPRLIDPSQVPGVNTGIKPMPTFPGGNMGPNFGGAMPGVGGIGSYGGGNDLMNRGPFPPGMMDQYKAAMQQPRFGMAGGSYARQRNPRMMSPLVGLAQRLIQQTSRPVPSQPINNWGRANPTWE